MDNTESHLNLPERIHTPKRMNFFEFMLADPFFHTIFQHNLARAAERDAVVTAESEYPFEPKIYHSGIAYPKGYDKNGPFLQYKNKNAGHTFPSKEEIDGRKTDWMKHDEAAISPKLVERNPEYGC